MNTQLIVQPVPSNSVLPDYIFYKFDSLLPGNGFIINEDNDPHPLYYKLLKEKGNTFSWEYLEVGPKKWCVKISKREEDDAKETIGDMAVSDHRKALILRKYGLDFSFKGRRTLREACAEKNISTKNIERDLKASDQQQLVYTINYNDWELDYLADFIITNHHEYTRKTLRLLEDELEKNSKIIRQNHVYLLPLVEVFNQLYKNMTDIMLKEEQVFFPYIRFLVQVKKGNVRYGLPPVSIMEHISKLEFEHQKLGEQIGYLCEFTNNYTMPRIQHGFYGHVLQWLNEFDNDLHQHIHIENNILFPKAMKLEEAFLGSMKTSNAASDKHISSINHLASLL
jgi:regulator of cell morphogenesis and NO signaling